MRISLKAVAVASVVIIGMATSPALYAKSSKKLTTSSAASMGHGNMSMAKNNMSNDQGNMGMMMKRMMRMHKNMMKDSMKDSGMKSDNSHSGKK